MHDVVAKYLPLYKLLYNEAYAACVPRTQNSIIRTLTMLYLSSNNIFLALRLDSILFLLAIHFFNLNSLPPQIK